MKVIFMVTDAEVLKRWKYIAQEDEKLLILIGGPGSGKSRIIRDLTYQEGWKVCERRLPLCTYSEFKSCCNAQRTEPRMPDYRKLER